MGISTELCSAVEHFNVGKQQVFLDLKLKNACRYIIGIKLFLAYLNCCYENNWS